MVRIDLLQGMVAFFWMCQELCPGSIRWPAFLSGV